MTHDIVFIISAVITWGLAAIGAGLGSKIFNDRIMGFICGVAGGFIGLLICITIFGIKS